MTRTGSAVLAPDSRELADAAAGWAGVYVHIPFCARICPYCDFAVVESKSSQAERYVEAVIAEIAAEPPWRMIDALFIGGGTPSSIDPELIGRIVTALDRRFGLAGGAELTIEANPEDWSAERSDRLAAVGIDRVSFGAQSFDPAVLDALGRRHGPADIEAAVRLARASGYRSISLDLMFGTPGESARSWRDTLEAAVALPIDHVSTYALTVERGTPLSREVAAGAPAPDEDDQADKYEVARRRLGDAGFVHYETSNYARAGHACRYNLTVWAQGEYLAFGLGAHRHREGERAWNVRRLEAYLERVEAGASPRSGSERLEPDAAEVERMLIGLRRRAGVEAGPAGTNWFAGEEGRRLSAAGLVELSEGRLRVLDPLLADTVARSIAGCA
jgi:oxygen-independent coproporphyrinogen-3 oxidase